MRWYLKSYWVVVWILAAGPFALPVLWLSPAFKKWHKAALTLLILALTVWMVNAAAGIYTTLLRDLKDLQGLY